MNTLNLFREARIRTAQMGKEFELSALLELLSNSKKKGWCIPAFSCLPYSRCWRKEPRLGGGNNFEVIHDFFSNQFVLNAEKIGVRERSPGTE